MDTNEETDTLAPKAQRPPSESDLTAEIESLKSENVRLKNRVEIEEAYIAQLQNARLAEEEVSREIEAKDALANALSKLVAKLTGEEPDPTKAVANLVTEGLELVEKIKPTGFRARLTTEMLQGKALVLAMLDGESGIKSVTSKTSRIFHVED